MEEQPLAVPDGGDDDNGQDGRLAKLNVAERRFQQGLQAIKDGRLEDAVSLLYLCLMARIELHGAAAPETASAYYRYGAALLYSVQDSADVFGGEMLTAAQQHDDQVDGTTAATDEEGPSVGGPSVGGPSVGGPSDPTSTSAAAGDDQGDDTQAAPEAEGTPSDVQLAWENLETAKSIYAAQGDSCSLELADVVMLLGDLSAEDDAFDRALPDYREAMAILRRLPEDKPAPVQRFAELHFKASLALQVLNRIPEAMTETKDAISLCKQRLSVLRKADAATSAVQLPTTSTSAAADTAATKVDSSVPESPSSAAPSDGLQAGSSKQVESATGSDPQGTWPDAPTAITASTTGQAAAKTQSAAEAEAIRLTDSLEGLQDRVTELQDKLDEELAARNKIKAAYSSAMAMVGSTTGASAAFTSAARSAASSSQAPPSAQPIQDLGVIGRGTKRRLTPVPIGVGSSVPSAKIGTTEKFQSQINSKGSEPPAE